MVTKNSTKGHDQALEIDHNQSNPSIIEDAGTLCKQKVEKFGISFREKIEKFEAEFIKSFSNMPVDNGSQKVLIYANSKSASAGHFKTSVLDELMIIEGFCRENSLFPVKLFIDYPSELNQKRFGWKTLIASLITKQKPDWFTKNMELVILGYSDIGSDFEKALYKKRQAESLGLRLRTVALQFDGITFGSNNGLLCPYYDYHSMYWSRYAKISARYRELRIENIRNLELNRQNKQSGSTLEKSIIYVHTTPNLLKESKSIDCKQVEIARGYCKANHLEVIKVFKEICEPDSVNRIKWNKLVRAFSGSAEIKRWTKDVESLVVPDIEALNTDFAKLMEMIAQLSYLGIKLRTINDSWNLADERDIKRLKIHLINKSLYHI